jgi:hypothetical protein
MVYNGKSYCKMDDLGGTPHFKKPQSENLKVKASRGWTLPNSKPCREKTEQSASRTPMPPLNKAMIAGGTTNAKRLHLRNRRLLHPQMYQNVPSFAAWWLSQPSQKNVKASWESSHV